MMKAIRIDNNSCTSCDKLRIGLIRAKYYLQKFGIVIQIAWLIISINIVAVAQKLPLLTIQEAVQKGLNNHPLLESAKVDYQIAQTQNHKGTVGYYPDLTFNITHTHSVQNTQLDFFDGRKIEQKGAYSNNTNSSINSQWILFDGGVRSHLKKQLELIEATAKSDVQITLESLIYQICSAYLIVARNKLLVKMLSQQMQLSQNNLQNAILLVNAGSGNNQMILQRQINVHQDSLLLTQSLKDLELSKLALLQTMNEPMMYDFDVQEDFLTNKYIADIEDHIKLALNQNPTLKKMRMETLQSDELVKASQAANFPQLSAIGGLSYNLSNNQANFVIQASNLGPQIGLNLAYPILDNGLRKRQIQTAKLQAKKSETLLEYQKYQIESEIRIQYQQYLKNQQLRSQQEKSIAIFRENLQLAEDLLQLGQLTEIEWREAQTAYTQANITLLLYDLAMREAILGIFFIQGNISSVLE